MANNGEVKAKLEELRRQSAALRRVSDELAAVLARLREIERGQPKPKERRKKLREYEN
jgi:hypothetical protein